MKFSFGSNKVSDMMETYYKDEDGLHPRLSAAFDWAQKEVFDMIDDDEHVILAGGALRSFFTDTPVRDFDIYSLGKEVSNSKYTSSGYARESKTERSEVWKRVYAETGGVRLSTFNIITDKIYNSPQEVISNFDFTVCMCAITPEQITYHPDYFLDLTTKKLRLNDPSDILSSFWRLQKYNKLGYTMDREELWSMIEQVHDLPNLPQIKVNSSSPATTTTPLTDIFRSS